MYQQQTNQQHQPKPRGRRKKVRTEPVRPICSQCDKQFSNQSALTKHKLTHSDERKFACQQCSKAFKRHDHLTGHMQTHSNRKPFNCTIQGCDKTYCDARSLRRHKENIHHIVPQCNLAQRKSKEAQPQHQQQQHQHTQHTSLENIAIAPHSAGSMTDSGLGLNAQYERHHGAGYTTPTTLRPPTNGHYEQCPTATGNHQHLESTHNGGSGGYITSAPLLPPAPITAVTQNGAFSDDDKQQQQQQQTYQQMVPPQEFNSQQPSHLLKRRTQRLLSDGSVYSDVQPTRLELTNRRLDSIQNQHYHASFSADYASTQSTHFSFDFNNNQVEHTSLDNIAIAPHSAGSMTDSGLGLNVQYEHHHGGGYITPTTLHPPTTSGMTHPHL